MDTAPRDVSFERQRLSLEVRQLARQPRVRALAALCLFAVVFLVAYRYAMSFTNDQPAPFWFPDAVLLCALLRTPVRWWWVPLLVSLPIRLFVAVPPQTPLWFL